MKSQTECCKKSIPHYAFQQFPTFNLKRTGEYRLLLDVIIVTIYMLSYSYCVCVIKSKLCREATHAGNALAIKAQCAHLLAFKVNDCFKTKKTKKNKSVCSSFYSYMQISSWLLRNCKEKRFTFELCSTNWFSLSEMRLDYVLKLVKILHVVFAHLTHVLQAMWSIIRWGKRSMWKCTIFSSVYGIQGNKIIY